MDMVIPQMQKLDTVEDRLKVLMKYLRRFGVPEDYMFSEKDLVEFKNIPKVTRCVAMLGKMVSTENRFHSLDSESLSKFIFQANVPAFKDLNIEIPPENEIYTGDSSDDDLMY